MKEVHKPQISPALQPLQIAFNVFNLLEWFIGINKVVVLWSVEYTHNNTIDSNNHSATISILDRFIMQSPKILLSKSTLERIR